MKRERLEDLGRIAELIRQILRDDYDFVEINPFNECISKHTIDQFVKKYNREEKLEQLHDWIRHHKERLEEIDTIAWGYDYDEN